MLNYITFRAVCQQKKAVLRRDNALFFKISAFSTEIPRIPRFVIDKFARLCYNK